MKSAVEMYTCANKLNYEGQSAVAHTSWCPYANNCLVDEGSSFECDTTILIPVRFETDRCIKPATFVRPLMEIKLFSLPSTGICVGRDEIMKDRSDPLSCSLITRDTVGSRVEVEITRRHGEVDGSGSQ
jgi:hypothetical protein